jgi:hypothetical protein
MPRKKAVKEVKQELPDMNQALDVLTQDDWTVINQALSNSGLSIAELIRKGLLAESKRINSHAEKLASVDPDKLVATTLSGAANLRIKAAIDAIVTHNESCQDAQDRIFVSINTVRSATNSNLATIKKYFAEHQSEIDKLNAKYKAPETKPRGYDVKATLGLR